MWDQILQLAATDLNEPAQFAAISKLVDLTDLIDNCLVLMYAGAEGWGLSDGSKLRAYYRRGSKAKLRFMIENADSIFTSGSKTESVGVPLPLDGSAQRGSFAYLFQQLMKSEEFRKVFSARVEKWFGKEGVLETAACEQRYRAIIGEVEPALTAELARWGDVHSSDPNTLMLDWQEQKEWTLKNWFPNRTDTILKELKRYGLISDNLDAEIKSQ